MSFSLVAGALCSIYFTNSIVGYTTPNITLNINSTGAKSAYPTAGAYLADANTWYTKATSTSEGNCYARGTLCFYTGSAYYCTSYDYESYSDYSDYTD